MKQKNKKGFTIVELVIVIAIVAILAAVLIPTFGNIIKKAQQSSDTQLIRNLNDALAIDLAEKEEDNYATCFDAMQAVEEAGYNVARIVAKSGYNIAWDSKTGYFVLLNEQKSQVLYPIDEMNNKEYTINNNEDKINYFVIRSYVNSEDYIAPEYYSLYAGIDFNAKNISLDGICFDAGINENIENINYINSSNIEKNIVIRSNSYKTNLNVNGPLDTVKHYGVVGYVNILAVADHSYIEYGDGAIVQIKDGHVEITKDANISNIHITKKEDKEEFEDITITIEEGALLPEMTRDSIELNNNSEVKVCTIETTDKTEDVVLTRCGIVEQVKLVSNTEEVRYAEYVENPKEETKDLQNSAAVMLANELTGFSRDENGKLNNCTVTKKDDNEEIISVGEFSFNYETREFVYNQTEGKTLTEEESNEQLQERVVDKGIDSENVVNTALSKFLPSVWDGSIDTSWYDESKDEFIITNGSQLAGLAELVNNGNTFKNKTIKLGADIDLKTSEENPKEWMQIGKVLHGYIKTAPFMGTFDGQNKTISNIYQWCYDDNGHDGSSGYGFFGCIDNAIIKNLTISNAMLGTEEDNVYGGYGLGGFVGVAFGDCTFDTLTLKDSYICGYMCNLGGIVGGCTSGNMTFNNITVDDTNVLTTWNWGCWSSCDTQIGGIVGTVDIQEYYEDKNHTNANGLYTTHVEFNDCTISCKLMQMNDVCSNYWWYKYRSSGMLIGGFTRNKYDGLWNNVDNITDELLEKALTCSNVSVIYDMWNHQMYCHGEGLGRYGGEGFCRIDDTTNHTHEEGMEDICIVFDQLIGGWSGGTWRYETGNTFEAYSGVNITYLNDSQNK